MHILDGKSVIEVLKRTLYLVDDRLVTHGERISFIVYRMLMAKKIIPLRVMQDICIMALVHDIGIYKTEERNTINPELPSDQWNHFIYGYLFLKLWVPSNQYAEIVLFHHLPYQALKELSEIQHKEYANLIQLADHVDRQLRKKLPLDPVFFNHLIQMDIDETLVDLFHQANDEFQIVSMLRDETYHQVYDQIFEQLVLSNEEAIQYLQLVAYMIDFRSEFTVAHTMMVVEVAEILARVMQFDEVWITKIRIGALLHDLGKISTPLSILEKSGQLTVEETRIMEHHVVMTNVILRGCIDDDIRKIAARHHEKMDGSGYPYGLMEHELSIPEMIIAVADITSALIGKRSYKDNFSKEKSIEILNQMSQNNEINKEITDILIQNYDEIIDKAFMNMEVMVTSYYELKKDFILLSEIYQNYTV